MKSLILIIVLVCGCASAFDFLLFVQVWPPTWTKSSSANFKKTVFDYFTIHGIWPEYDNGSWPQYCNKSAKFNLSKIEKLIPQLKKYWTNFKNPYNFWKHEYLKHATCVTNDTLLNDEFKYFSAGLELHHQFPVYTVLAKSGILPDNNHSYSVDLIDLALENYFDYQPLLICEYLPKKTILSGVWWCVNKNMEPMECPPAIKIRHQQYVEEYCQRQEWYYLQN